MPQSRRINTQPWQMYLEHVDVAEVDKGALLDVRHATVVDENALEAAHAAEGATVDAVEVTVNDGE